LNIEEVSMRIPNRADERIMDEKSNSGASKELPLHALPNDAFTKVRRLPGRPRRVEKAPDLDELEYASRSNASRAAWIEQDELLQAMRGGADVGDVLHCIRERLAREAAGFEFDLTKATANGRDAAQLVARRIDALLKLAAIEVARHRLSIDDFDARSPRVQQVVDLLVAEIRDVATQVLPPDDMERVRQAFCKRLDGWEHRLGR
jgi:hypothetical protein